MPKLIITRGASTGREFNLTVFPAVIGRAEGVAVGIQDLRASRNHAQVVAKDGTFVLEDLGSRNGTRLNNQFIQSAPLADEDRVGVCDTEFIFKADEVRRSASVAPHGARVASVPTSGMFKITGDAGPQPALSAVIDARSLGLGEIHKGANAAADQANARLRTMVEVATQLSTIHDANELLNEIMNRLFSIFPQAERGFILLRQPDGSMTPQIIRRPERDTEGEITVSSTILRRVVEEKHSVLLQDAPKEADIGRMQSIVNFKIKSMMVAPLLYQGEVLGAVHIDTTRTGASFNQDDLSLLTGVASSAAIALKNAMLLDTVRKETSIRTALARHLSPALVDKFVAGDLELGKLGGEVKTGTIFFSDIIGFTSIAERIEDPRVVVDLLNHYLATMEEIIFRRNGTIDKFSGDAIMAYWGVLLDNPNAVRDAVSAAVEMQNAMMLINAELKDKDYREELRMGIGINTGRFLAGNIGSEQKIEFTLIGDNVNLGQRIESLAGRGQIFVSEATYREIAAFSAAIRLPPVEVKNKAQPIVVYSIRGIDDPAAARPSMLLSIPVHLEDGEGGANLPARLTRVTMPEDGSLEMDLVTCKPLDPQSEHTVVPDLREYTRLPEFKVRVLGAPALKRPQAGRAASAVGEYPVKVVEPPKPFRQFLRPGTVIDADISAREMKRE
jgi:adenylate cyclase